MRISFFILTIFLSFSGQAQELVLRVISVVDRRPISSAVITISDENSIKLIDRTDSNGVIHFKNLGLGKFLLSIKHVDYQELVRDLIFKKIPSDTIQLFLRPIKIQNLAEVKIKAAGRPDTLYAKQEVQVDDFAILKNGDLLVVTHTKFKKNDAEVVLFNSEIEQKVKIDAPVKGMYRDFDGRIYLQNEDKAEIIRVEKNRIFLDSIDDTEFKQNVVPIVGRYKDLIYISDYQYHYPEVNYYKFQKDDTLYYSIAKIRDALMMELYRSEYKWVDVRTKIWAKEKEIETGIDAEIWVGANYFTSSLYYQPVYAPFFIKDREILIFNYYEDRMYRYNLNGELLESVYINHHYKPEKTGWKSLIQDQKTKEIFAVYSINEKSFLGKVNTDTGEVLEKTQLFFKGAKKIQVFDHHVFYIYRPFESIQTNYLYKERLPFNVR
ncbi:MAG: hypothetical protein KJ941_12470 [Bacteroidetes bacterium]|nr:hypothetical protein [Bacteroidota bacterium]